MSPIEDEAAGKVVVDVLPAIPSMIRAERLFIEAEAEREHNFIDPKERAELDLQNDLLERVLAAKTVKAANEILKEVPESIADFAEALVMFIDALKLSGKLA